MSPITLTLCHGTDSEFQGFNVNECNECGAFGRGFYFSNDFELERVYSDGLDPVVAKVTLQNPYILDVNLPMTNIWRHPGSSVRFGMLGKD